MFATLIFGCQERKKLRILRTRNFAALTRDFYPEFSMSLYICSSVRIQIPVLIAIGISQRTSAEAIDLVAKNMFNDEKCNIDTILAFKIPECRAFMHLDTVFTQIDIDKFTYHPGIMDTLEVFEITKNEDNLDEVIKKGTKTKTVLGTYIMKELKDIVRSNTNVIQLVVPPFLILIIGAISIFVTIFGQESSAEGLQTIINNMRSLITFDSGFLIFFVTAFALFLSSMTLISACAISREGKNASLLKYVPVSPFIVMISKTFWGITLTSIIEIIVILGLGFGLNIHWSIIVLCIVTSISATILANIIMYLVDLSRPYLDWVNEIDPIKQNMNVLFSLLACWAVAIVFIILGYLSMANNFTNIFVAASVIIGICFIIILALLLHMKKNKSKIFDKIQ